MVLRPPLTLTVGPTRPISVCLKCIHGLVLPAKFWTLRNSRRTLSTTTIGGTRDVAVPPPRSVFRGKEYFLANSFLEGNKNANVSRRSKRRLLLTTGSSAAAVDPSRQSNKAQDGCRAAIEQAVSAIPIPEEYPHRRRWRQRHLQQESISPILPPAEFGSSTPDPVIPPDASSRLTTLSSALPSRSLRRLITAYLSLSKPRLSFLIVLTTTTAYSLYPVPALLLPSTTASPSLSTLTLLFLTTGTALTCASANAFNMLLEPSHDAKMSRTRNRPLVRKLISPRGALAFAITTGLAGLGALYYGVNPTVAFLGGFNIFLYAGIYTPLKRISVLNTWVGALVGGIPPLMGWAAAAGQSATGTGGWNELLLGEGSAGGWLLAALLFTWQFPHFNALSWTIREEYKNAGYRMLAWMNPRMNARVAVRYSLAFFPICVGLWWVGVTDQGFLVTSSVINAWIVREALRFWRKQGAGGSARGLFWASVWHLPVVLVLAMAHKKGLWEGVWNSVSGAEEAREEG
ncbi:MAG: Protoheme IX farnesyltransferase, mitochondrial [Trichoglossum hirsutum]|nr:MAG: Protoheme IX farnesyltransferase, mitochondrial [Trichoglossum hirsutum]